MHPLALHGGATAACSTSTETWPPFAIRSLPAATLTLGRKVESTQPCRVLGSKDLTVWLAWVPQGLGAESEPLGLHDSVIQHILRHSTGATTQNHNIKTVSPDGIAAMSSPLKPLLCSACAPVGTNKAKGSVQ